MKSSSFISRSLAGTLFFTFFLFNASLYALSMEIQSGKEKGSTYSTLHITHERDFICEESHNEFDEVTKIECFFDAAPIKSFSTVKNGFFSITSYETPKLFVVKIRPFQKIKLYHVKEDLATNIRVVQQNARRGKHWMVVGYKESLPLVHNAKVPLEGLNFPIDFSNDDLPHVGALGLDGRPIELEQVEDISEYLEVRKFYTREQYDQVITTIDKALRQDPNSIFKSEFLLYKIRTLMRLDKLDGVIEKAKDFLREFSGDEAVPEVLLHLANAASKMGLVIDAEYFYDRLLTEHYESKEATMGLIALGKHTLSKGDTDKALRYYRQALEKAETKEIASDAAYRITNYYLSVGDAEKASTYIQKIATGNVEYLLEDYERTFEIAKEFSDRGAYIEAANLMSELIKKLEKTDRRYEGTLYQVAVWYDLGNENETAYKLYQQYVKEFEYGDFLPEIQERIDKVLFEIGDVNATKQLALYDTIAQKYADQEIADQSRYNKAKLLHKEKRYDEVLGMKQILYRLNQERYPDVNKLISESARLLTQRELENKVCEKAVLLLRGYDFNLTKGYSDELYHCTMDVSDYKYAAKLAEPFIKDPDMGERLKWLYRYVKSSAKIGDDKIVYVMGEDLLNLAKIENNTTVNDVMKDLFRASLRLKKEDKALEWITKIEEHFGLRYSDIELYMAMSKLAKEKRDQTMIETYATKVVTLQKKSQSYTFSPEIEFMLISALKKLKKSDKAYLVAKDLTAIVTKEGDKARAFYELGSIAQKLGRKDESKKALKLSAEASKTSPWSKLSRDVLELMK